MNFSSIFSTFFCYFSSYSILIVLIAKYALVKILRNISSQLNLKPKTTGYIAGIATSIPELLTVSFSAFTGLIETSTYNIISSNIINALQYSASVFLNKNQNVVKNTAIKVDLLLVLITILIPIFIAIFDIEHNFILVPIFIFLFVLFYRLSHNAHKLYMKKNDTKVEEKENSSDKSTFKVILNFLLLVITSIVLYFIGEQLSNVLEVLCHTFNISQIVIGILLGVITSLPELITFFESQKHHEDEKEGVVEATSNLLTSNMINLFIVESIGITLYLIS